jgi:hypothetical protein
VHRLKSAGRRALPRRRRGVTAALTAALLGLSLTSSAYAAPIFALQVTGSRAPYFVLSGHPGMSLNGNLTVINVGSSRGGVSLYAADATTGQTSGAVYRSAQDPRRDVGGWVQLAQHHLTLGPGQAAVVPFQVSVPGRVRGGQHLGGIVAQPDQPLARVAHRHGKATFHVRVRSIAVIAVELNLPGPRIQHIAITGVRAGAEPGYQTVLIGLASTGTALTKGSGAITVTDAQGRRRLHRAFRLDTLVPQTQIRYPVQVSGRALPAGTYRAAITISYAGHTEHRTLPFTITGKNLAEVFSSHPTAAPATQGGGQSMIPIIVGGLALVLVGFTVGARLRTRRPASR